MPRHVITPAPTAVTLFIGDAETGPDNTPVPIKSMEEFGRIFSLGGQSAVMAAVVAQFFQQGGTDAVVFKMVLAPGVPPDHYMRDLLAGASFNILCLASDSEEYEEAIGACAPRQAMAVLQTMSGYTTVAGFAQLMGSGFEPRECAAVYYPNLQNGVPVGGAIAGLWARTDREDGVWTAPAWPNHGRLLGVVPDPPTMDHDAWAALAKSGINGLGTNTGDTEIWSARTLALREEHPPDWHWDIPVRRTLVFIEQSLRNGLHWVAQEKNGPQLWNDVTESARDFLSGLQSRGAFKAAPRVTCTGSGQVLHLSVEVALQDPAVLQAVALDLSTA